MKGKKRANAEGSIRQRADGVWEARYVDEQGRRKSLYGPTRQDVHRKLMESIHNRDQGLPSLANGRQTLGSYLPKWLVGIEPTVKTSTFRRYEQLVRKHLVPAFDKMPLSRLTPTQIEELYVRMMKNNLSPRTVQQTNAVLHHALRDAMRKGLVLRNVTELANKPRVRRRTFTHLSPDQARTLFQAAKGERLEALFVLAVYTGARLGELLALRWSDLALDDPQCALVQINGNLTGSPRGGFVIEEPKTRDSQRVIALSSPVVEMLRAHRKQQIEERLRAGEAWRDHDLVFCNEVGGHLHGISVLRYRFYPLLKRAGLPRVRFHDLRHTFASLHREMGTSLETISLMLGHSGVSITADVYVHTGLQVQRAAQEGLARLLNAQEG